MDFDPYVSAKRMNDQFALDSWAKYEVALLSAPVIAISPQPFLQYEHPEKANEYGALPEIWEESTRQILKIYERSFAQVVAQLADEAKIERRSYTPPSGYGKGGPIGFPIELLELVYDQDKLMDVGIDVFETIIADAVIRSGMKLRQWMIEHKVPEAEQIFPSHNPFIVRAVVEDHAHRHFPNLMPGPSTVYADFPFDADYPVTEGRFLVILTYPKGSIIYLVDAKLRRPLIVRTTPKGSMELDSSNWMAG